MLGLCVWCSCIDVVWLDVVGVVYVVCVCVGWYVDV